MQLSDFDYQLPEQLIAQTPLAERCESRLLVVNPANESLADRQFSDLEKIVEAGDLLVFNNTRVIPARLFGHKQSGGKLEVMVERVLDAEYLLAHIRSSKAPMPGSQLVLEKSIKCTMVKREKDLFVLRQQTDKSWLDLLEQYGHVPLPPYIRRADEMQDRARYQTVYAEFPGAVAAPTAGLHFDQGMIDRLSSRGVNTAYVTLHVGAGTFQPVRGDDIDSHVMHAECIDVPQSVCDAVIETKKAGKRVVAVGTTVVRSLETAASTGKLLPLEGESRLFIKPGFKFEVIDAMITNFHLPKSTLLMLVSAFAGSDIIRQAYAHAITQQYRFFSYGDAMFISALSVEPIRIEN
jgi:S-adenosylmethionine:tRNA ribosyltransferase-isomerase